MFNPPNDYRIPGSRDDLLKRMTQRLQQDEVDDKIRGMLEKVFEEELDKTNLALSRPERIRLFRQVIQAVFADILGTVGGTEQP